MKTARKGRGRKAVRLLISHLTSTSTVGNRTRMCGELTCPRGNAGMTDDHDGGGTEERVAEGS